MSKKRLHACDLKVGQRVSALFWDPNAPSGRRRAVGTVVKVKRNLKDCAVHVRLDSPISPLRNRKGQKQASLSEKLAEGLYRDLPFEQGITLIE
jgi:hypothetical protein